MKVTPRSRAWVLACCLLLTGCGGPLFGEAKDTSPRIYYEDEEGNLVATRYTIDGMERALRVTRGRGEVERQGNEWLKVPGVVEVYFQVIGQDRVLLQRVEDWAMKQMLAHRTGPELDEFQRAELSRGVVWGRPANFVKNLEGDEGFAKQLDVPFNVNKNPRP